MAYWCGGRAGEREQADERLRACVAEHGGNGIATLLYWGVRVGGHPWLPFYWRWGYGWPWARGYAGAVE
jgi:hypothetical protein